MRTEYFKDPAISRGLLLNFKQSSRSGAVKIEEEKDTTALIFGRAFHVYMEDDKGINFFKNYYVFDDSEIYQQLIEEGVKSPRSTSKYKTWKAEQEEVAQDRIIISSEDFNKIEKMAQNIMGSFFYKKTVKAAKKIETEKAFYAEINGKKYKALADVVIERENDILVIDWKSTRAELSNDEFSISREIRKWDLHVQDFHYRKVIKKATGKDCIFIFVFCENHGAHEVLPVSINQKADLISEGGLIWEKCNLNYEKFKAGKLQGIDSELEQGLLIIN